MSTDPDPTDPSAEGDDERVRELATQAGQDLRGVRVLASSQFSLQDSVGGVRGLIEALAPGVVFVVVYVVTRELTPTLVASLAVTLVAVVARLVQRTPLTQALSGLFGVAIGVFWAWRTGEARDFFQFGLWTNGAYLAVCLVSILVRWPVVGLVVELVRGAGRLAEDTDARTPDVSERGEPIGDSHADNSGEGVADEERVTVKAVLTGWRADRALVRRYAAATWLWVALFAARLVVQLPLYLAEDEVGWLGTARLVMGVPLWALTLWLTWILVRTPAAGTAPSRPRPGR